MGVKEINKGTFVCADCGNTYERNSGRQLLCAECREKRKSQRNIVGKPMICQDCGKEIIRKNSRQIRCVDCAGKIRSVRSRQWRGAYEARQQALKEEKARKARLGPRRSTLSQLALEARALGLSYGKYTILLSQGRLDEWCRINRVNFSEAVMAAELEAAAATGRHLAHA